MRGALHPAVSVAFRLMLNEAQGRARFEPLPDEEEAALAEAAEALAKRLPCWGSFPADAQLAMLRWAWVNGATSKRFPALFQALKPAPGRPLPDFALAAEACCWHDMSLPARLVMGALWQNAADSLTWGLPADRLIWPSAFRRAALPDAPTAKDETKVAPSPLKNGVKLALAMGAAGVFAFQMGKRRPAVAPAVSGAPAVGSIPETPAGASTAGLPTAGLPRTAEEIKAAIAASVSRLPYHPPLPKLPAAKRGWHGAPSMAEVRRLNSGPLPTAGPVGRPDEEDDDSDYIDDEPLASFGSEEEGPAVGEHEYDE